MKKLFLILMILWCGVAWAQEKEIILDKPIVEQTQDYWVYVRLEDRSGVTTADDAGRSKAGDVVAVLPVSPKHIPSETEKKEWMIYKASLTEAQRDEMLLPWVETETKTEAISIPKEIYEDTAKKEEYLASLRAVSVTSATAGTKDYSMSAVVEYDNYVAYRKNKVDTSKLGVKVEKGLIPTKIDASKISVDAKTTADLSRYETKRKFYAYVQRPLKMVANKIIKPVFAETISTINKTGEDYNTITLWEDAVDGDLVTNTSQPTAECYDDDGTLSDPWDIDGSTTNATYYLKITSPVGERHDGTNSSGFLNTVNNQVNINDEYTVIEWLRISGSGQYIDVFDGDNATSIMRNCIITGGEYKTLKGKFNVYNTILLARSYDIAISAGGFRKIINVTAIQTSSTTGKCISGYDNDFVLVNTICQNFTTTYEGYGVGGGRTFATNLSDDTQFPGTSVDSTTLSFVGSGDYHLSASDTAAIDAGTDYSGTFTTDIDGVTRSGTWDIGADEYVAAGGSTYYPFKKFNHGIMTGVF